MRFNKKLAFSVAEAMITLLIMGVIFAMYAPVLNKSVHKIVTQTTLTDAIKNFNSALYNYSQNQSCNGNLACTDLFSGNDNSAGEKLSTVFNSSKSQTNNCWESNISNPDTNLSDYSCVLDIKNVIFATQRLSNCSTDLKKADGANNIPANHKLGKSCGYVYIDTNGEKEPNQFGKDVYIFVITNSAPSYLYPVGGEFWEDTTNFNNIGECPTDGRACAGEFVKNRGKITFWN